MQFTISKRFIRDELPLSPEIEPRKEFIKLSAGDLAYADGRVALKFYVSYLFPGSLVQRYRFVDEALVLIVNDLNQQDCFATNFTSSAYVPAPGMAMSSNLIDPPQMLAVPDEEELKSLSGGWINGELSFDSPGTLASVSIYLYVVLENYFSNVVGIDLNEKETVYF
jgi:hypothetical protein